jgi:F0F1-type ATP synthase membrane subunit c/vacuolar-type H+-ATPase subunit K
MPGLISGVPVYVGKASRVGVAEAGNQTMVAVGIGVSDGGGVGVGRMGSRGRQAVAKVVAMISTVRTTLILRFSAKELFLPEWTRCLPVPGNRM